VFVVLCVCSCAARDAAYVVPAEPARASTARLHRDLIVADAHSDVVLWLEAGLVDLARHNSKGQTDLPRLRAGGVDVVAFNLWADPLYIPQGRAASRTRHMIDVWRAAIARNHDQIAIAHTKTELDRILAAGKIAAIGKIEGSHALGGHLDAVASYKRLGVSILGLTWHNTNALADACCDQAKWGGLSPFGARVVREANRWGVIIDTAHASEAAALAAAAVSTKPIICSHTAVHALTAHPRNVSDAVIRAIARTGGVVHIAAINSLLSAAWSAAHDTFRAAHATALAQIHAQYHEDWLRRTIALNRFYAAHDSTATIPPLPVERLIDHIDYVVALVGVDHVGIGSDFDGLPRHYFPADLQDYAMFPRLTAALVRRGYTRAEVAKIMGGNLLRVFAEATH
jgi:membrane dipeptidase